MSLHLRAAKLPQSEYDKKVAAALDRLYATKRGEAISVERSSLRVVVMSDLHRGARDGADDFERAERAYSAALGWYLEERYALWLLGDVEELWENDVKEVVPDAYKHLLKLEREFAEARGGPGLRRFWGNHDLDWADEDSRAEHLDEYLAGSPVEEGLCVEVREDSKRLGIIFFAHGHQGTDSSDRFRGISRFFVRRIWRKVQASQGWLLAWTPLWR